mmetsp:Transcript_7767/g.17902  ORF Transcript_7767/g.17902 Transcript_7767/m.17902 type:complete len:251 (+) Transcript_7767:1007-1759(+)
MRRQRQPIQQDCDSFLQQMTRDAAKPTKHSQGLASCHQINQRIDLRAEADILARRCDTSWNHPRNIMSRHEGLSCCRSHISRQHSQGGGLSSSVHAKQTVCFTLGDCGSDSAHCPLGQKGCVVFVIIVVVPSVRLALSQACTRANVHYPFLDRCNETSEASHRWGVHLPEIDQKYRGRIAQGVAVLHHMRTFLHNILIFVSRIVQAVIQGQFSPRLADTVPAQLQPFPRTTDTSQHTAQHPASTTIMRIL